jgi:hypothetical protein
MHIFTYWTGNRSVLTPFMGDWSGAGLDVAVYGPEDVCGIVPDPELFRAVSIPACQSDVARLALLHRHGGLYVDAHAGKPNVDMLRHVFDTQCEVTIFATRTPRNPDGGVVNSAIRADQASPFMADCVGEAFANLAALRSAEVSAGGWVRYNIAALTGSWLLNKRACVIGAKPPTLRADACQRVALYPLWDSPHPFALYAHYGYRTPGEHWSERQKHERLFTT